MLAHFTKMHGTGNDFLVLDLVSQSVQLTPEIISALADRHTGIGFDCLLAAEPPTNPEADFFYRIYNADGSEAEQCGNGARCLAKFVYDKQLTPKRKLTFQCINGLISAELLADNKFKINMGEPNFSPEKIPFTTPTQEDIYRLSGYPDDNHAETTVDIEFLPVSMGNPHAVIQVPSVSDIPIDKIGPWLSTHPMFPEGANVSFIEIEHPGRLQLRVYERGVGETLACGTGACAAVAVAQHRQLVSSTVDVVMQGGQITVQWQGPNHDLFQIGPAKKVYDGRVKI